MEYMTTTTTDNDNNNKAEVEFFLLHRPTETSAGNKSFASSSNIDGVTASNEVPITSIPDDLLVGKLEQRAGQTLD